MRIALLTDGIWPFVIGGMQKHSYYLCKYLAQNNVNVDLYHTAPQRHSDSEFKELFSDAELNNITHFFIDYPVIKNYPAHYLKESYDYSKALYNILKLRIHEYDLLYIQGFAGWYYLQRKKKCVDILNFHGLNMFQKSEGFRNYIESYIFKYFVKKQLNLSSFVQSLGGKLTLLLENEGIEKGKIVELGIAIENNWQSNNILSYSATRTFTFIGRYERVKGVEELSAVLLQMIEENDFEFNFIGPFPSDKQIKSNKIKYFGQLSNEGDIKKILDKTDFLVLPSHSEGMPTVILEAMARGCAVIACDVGAVSELVNKDNGFLIPANNKNALYNTMKRAIEINGRDLDKMKTTSLAIAKKFTWNILSPNMINVFNAIVKSTKMYD